MANQFRGPLFTYIYKRRINQYADFWSSPLVVLLPPQGVSAGFPASGDTENPISRRPYLQIETYPNLIIRVVANPIPPCKPFDWPNPQNKRHFRVDSTPNTTLLGIPRTPFSQSDWPVPFKYKHFRLDETPNLIVRFLPPPVTTPFFELDWANPFKAKPLHQDHEVSGFTTRNIPPPVSAPPFFQSDFPLPPLATRPVRLDNPPNLLNSTLFKPVVVLPFSQTSWPISYRRYSWDIHHLCQNSQLPDIIPPPPPVTARPRMIPLGLSLMGLGKTI